MAENSDKNNTFLESEVALIGGGSVTLLVPRGLPGLPPLIFNLTEMKRIEARLPEVKAVTIHTWKELCGEFNQAYNILSKYIAAVEYELLVLKKYIDEVQAELLIDKYPDFYANLKKKGMSDNQQLRTSFFLKNDKYSMALNKLNALTALDSWIKIKAKVFVYAYQSAKKIVDAKNGNMGGYNG